MINSRRYNLGNTERMTLPVEIQKEAKKNLKPGPGAYEPAQKEKVLGAFNLKEVKSPSFLDDAVFRSSQSPSSYQFKLDSAYPRTLYTKIVPTKKTPADAVRIEKNDLPSPGTYNFDESFKKT